MAVPPAPVRPRARGSDGAAAATVNDAGSGDVVPPISRDDLRYYGQRAAAQASTLAARAAEKQIRVGVTGLQRSGKTVFVTSVIDNLLKGGRLPMLTAIAEDRFLGAQLRPPPAADVPRFAYEGHLGTLTGTPAAWPARTRGVNQIRLVLKIRPKAMMRRLVSEARTVTLDLVDYPGEWLLDLPLLDLDYPEWSARTIRLAAQAPRDRLSQDWRAWLGQVTPDQPADDETARQGAALYTAYLQACRSDDTHLSVIQPGRFVEPGDFANAPLLAFCPLAGADARDRRGGLGRLMADRYDAYKASVVRPFFIRHFARLHRQIVLVDLLGALNAGAPALTDMRAALTDSLASFRHGRGTWIERLTGTRVDRVLFAATKADHVAATQHANVRLTLDTLLADARREIRFAGAAIDVTAVAAVKCTRTVVTDHDGRQLACVEGIPAGRTDKTVLFTGDIIDPSDPIPEGIERPYRFMNFQPPPGLGRDGRGLPNIRLDQALEFLIGDHLA